MGLDTVMKVVGGNELQKKNEGKSNPGGLEWNCLNVGSTTTQD